MPRRKKKARRFFYAAVLMAATAGVAALIFLNSRPLLKERRIRANGQDVVYWQNGAGPHLVVLSPEKSVRAWEEVAASWLKSYTLSVLEDTRPESVAALLSEIKTPVVHLVGFDKAAAAAIERAAENKERVSKVILISPVLDQAWQWRVSVSSISQPTLLLWGRNDPEIQPAAMAELNHGLRNAQMSFHPKSRHDLISEHPAWVAEKVRNFIVHTGRSAGS